MVKVYLNPANLTDKIYHLGSFSSHTDVMSNNIRNRSHDLHDPIMGTPLPGSLSPISPGDIDYLTGAIKKSLTFINARIAEIEKCKKTIENLSSNGVAIPHSQGDITFEVPDDSAGLETADKLQKWAQGATDAHDLRSGEGKLPSGRSFDEVRESMKANKDDTTYANSVIDRIGPENLTWIGSADPDSNKEAPVLGEILATASKTWDTSKSERNADLIAESIDGVIGKEHRQSIQLEEHRIAIFNKMIGEHDSDGDGVSDLSFNSAFLQRLGTRLEVIKPNKVEATLGTYGDDNTMPKEVSQTDIDPLRGVIDAMTNNAEAAAAFFGNKGVNANEDDIDRIRNIVIRGDLGDNKWTNNFAIISDKMSEYGKIDTTKASPLEINRANQAALGTSVILNTLGQSNVNLSGTSLSHIGNALKNYAPGVDNSIQTAGANRGHAINIYLSGQIPNGAGGFTNDYTDAYWGTGVPTQPNFSDFALSNLTGQLGLTEHGLDGLKVQLGLISDARMKYAANPTDSTSDSDKRNALQKAIASYQSAQGFIAGAIEHEGVERKINADKQAKAWIDGISGVTSFVPLPGMTGVRPVLEHIFNAGVSYMQARGEKAAMDALEQQFASGESQAKAEAAEMEFNIKDESRKTILTKMIETGAIDRTKLADWGGNDANISKPDGTPNENTLLNRDGTINYETWRNRNNSEQFSQSVKMQFDKIHSNMSSLAKDEWAAQAYDNGVDTEFDNAKKRANSTDNWFGPRENEFEYERKKKEKKK